MNNQIPVNQIEEVVIVNQAHQINIEKWLAKRFLLDDFTKDELKEYLKNVLHYSDQQIDYYFNRYIREN